MLRAAFCLVCLGLAAAAPTTLPEQEPQKYDLIRQQLAQLQGELETLRGGGPKEDPAASLEALERDSRMPVIDFKKRMPVIDFKRGGRMEGSFLPHTLPGLSAKRAWPPLKRNWQPLKRAWQPLKRAATAVEPKFQMVLRDQDGLQQQLLETVEAHLSEDLAAAEVYGIAPQQILADLREKNQARRENAKR